MSTRAHTRKLRALVLVGLAGVALATISSFYLADTGTNTVGITPGSTLSSGSAFDVSDMGSSISRPNGNALLQTGVALARVKIAAGFGGRLKVDVAWLDPNDAAQVLNSPNAQLYVSIYHPTGQATYPAKPTGCTSNGSYDNSVAVITDNLGSGDVNYCAESDTGATGSLMTSKGQLILTPSNVAGYIAASLSDPSTSNGCTGSNSGAWCHPTALDGSTNVAWVAMTIVTPGGKPAGQQNNINSLRFFVQAKSI